MLTVDNLHKRAPSGERLLDGVRFRVEPGEFVGILGSSGSGKSLTIRSILGLVDVDEGAVRFAPTPDSVYDMASLRGRALRHARRQIGTVFQEFNLVERLTVLDNVLLGRLGRIGTWRSCCYGFTAREAREALQALARVNMASFAGRPTGGLSRGEMQRVALARAVFQEPALYLVDEPISSVDPLNARLIMELLVPLAKSSAVVGAFHQPEMTARYCSRVVAIRRGQVVYDGAPSIDADRLAEIYGEETSA